jgi:hypothetical protein
MDTSFNGSNFGSASYLANPGTSDWGNYGSEEDTFVPLGTEIGSTGFSNPKNTPLPWLKQGATDTSVANATGITGLVTRIQQALVNASLLSSSDVSGSFNKKTHDAVVELQTLEGIDIDGQVGPQTYKKLGWPDKVAKASKAKVQATSAVVVTEAMAPLEWYKRPSTMLIVGGIVTVSVLGILFWPKRK